MKKSFFALLTIMSMLIPSFSPVLAQEAPSTGTLIQGSGPAVYWYSQNGRRYVFPNMKTFYSWFTPYDLYHVNHISETELAAIPIGGNITYRPGSRLLKIVTDPRIYVVESGNTLRWIETEAIAASMYGPHWKNFIDDVPDAFFVGYSIGPAISSAATALRPVVALTPEYLFTGAGHP